MAYEKRISRASPRLVVFGLDDRAACGTTYCPATLVLIVRSLLDHLDKDR